MSKPTLLMIHGLAGSLDYFGAAARITHAEVHTFDLLGYGEQRDVAQDRLTLGEQALHVASRIAALPDTPVWLLGYSMGGAVAMLVADQRPERVAGIINVEGNFTLKDAFWAQKIVTKSPREWSEVYQVMRRDLPACLAKWGIEPNAQRIAWLDLLLDHQPPETVYAMSQAILEETADPFYLDAVRRVVARGVPLHLIAGERSAAGWDVPTFVRQAALSYIEIANAGHLMMLEEPAAFCQVVDSIVTPG
ncbi:MAG: alpha/beta fold hydrolase [Chloroflexi bacterium]|nr:alpha/beta fold hydrolase [Chloroflexota bacterium]